MYTRIYKYLNTQSFFLLGPRGCGKSTWLKAQFPGAFYVDLLDQALFQEFLRQPDKFKLALNNLARESWVIVDEVQRLPDLLNFVHQFIESERKLKFILTGSSARKLRRGHNINLLAGRALQRRFNPLSAEELGADFNLKKSLKIGHLPMAYTSEDPAQYLKSYVGTYLREEVQQEALVRNLASFASFLESATFSQGQVLSVQSIASDIGVDRKTAESYFQILEDMLLGYRIPVFQKKAKRKMTTKPKFYFFDVGVYRTLRRLGPLDSPDEITGIALETLVLQNIKSWIDSQPLDLDIYFFRSRDKHEVDFILYGPDGFFAIEVKKTDTFRQSDIKDLREFAKDYPGARLFYFYGGTQEMVSEDGIQVVPVEKALKNLSQLLTLEKE
ncbi:MAG: ATP-binding protein [Pseudobdellovibrionaceae bacterium]